MAIEHELVGANLIVRLNGELDLVEAAAFKRLVDDLLDRRKVRNLYVNLAQVTFVDSSFLGALLGRYRRINTQGGRMGIIRTPGPVRPTLELSGVFRMMAEYGSEQEALTAG
ncbi:MAG TPA: anti-sigma F factor antagonist [Symbiobacteriaceae bacterium]